METYKSNKDAFHIGICWMHLANLGTRPSHRSLSFCTSPKPHSIPATLSPDLLTLGQFKVES
jgi:hypothetical protein